MTNWDWVLHNPEGQFLERKSCYDRPGGRVRRRDVRSVARDIAETLSAMANADGGTVVVGIEDDGTPTGVDYPDDRLNVLREAPRNLVRPPLRARIEAPILHGMHLLVFEVDWSPEAHQLTDGRYLLRVGDQNQPFPAEQIEALKAGKRRRVAEVRIVPEASLADLDLTLLERLRGHTGLALSDEELLLRYRLAESRDGQWVLTLAALLLFGKDPGRWHPRCGIDFVKYEGTERRYGARLNIIKRERMEAPLLTLIEQVFETIRPHIRERQRLVDLFFEEWLEYPTFAWQEAIINAVAHRDYGFEGVGIEVWMFDDRLEVRSPGQLVEPVTLERLQKRERIHASRNPRIVRLLTDLGYMRELGEGIPRMFHVMEEEGLYPPEFRLEADVIFTVVLRNTPVYSLETRKWLRQFEPLRLSGNQKRLLAYAREHDGTFTSRAYQKLVGVDIYTSSQDIKDLIRKGVVRRTKKGGRVYRIAEPSTSPPPSIAEEFVKIEPVLQQKGFVQNKDVREIFKVSRLQAWRLLQKLVALDLLKLEGKGRNARYVHVENVSLLSRNASSSTSCDTL
ncbi:MAG: putative DNA binding domain-containing protein [Anaerolineales bacterium]|nr:putative DNA binding domain-containing protein [Anaerolineales bacterium]